jgi:hypothetical protein
VAGAEINAVSREIGISRTSTTDDAGRYQIAALPVGPYRLEVKARGFQTQIIENSRIEVGRRITQNFQLQVGDVSQMVAVPTNHELLEQSSMAVGQWWINKMVQETPLNGRYFLDLGLRVPGSVTPPQGAFSASPSRGVGRWRSTPEAIGRKPSTTVVNGITLNNLTFSSISFQLPINTIQEFKLDNSTFSAQYGESSGAIVNLGHALRR